MDKSTGSVSLSAELSRQARRQLGLSQRDVIDGTGLPAYKLKQWEARGLDIGVADLRLIRDFYTSVAEARGMTFDEIEAHFNAQKGVDIAANPATMGVSRLGFLIAPNLGAEVVDKLMSDMESSDERIAEIVKSGVQSGLFGGLSSETETLVQELFGHLAANHLRFRCLQGRNIIAATRDEARTVGDHLGQWVRANGVECIAAAADSELIEQD
jgi:hypothetical protein